MTHLGNRPKLSLKLGQIMLAMFFFLLFSISRFYNITKAPVWEDNMSWLYRIGHYTWILERNFKGNPEPGKDLAFAGKASYHPGVTVMTFSGISYRLVKKLAAANFPDYVPCGFSDYSCKYLWLELLATKIPIVLISGIGLGLTLFYVCRLCGWESAVLGGFLILVDPLLYLSSRDLHLDFLQGVFILMSLILFIYGVFKKKSNYFFFSGVLYGLAMLTRFASVLYLPGYLAVLFLAVIPRGTEEKKTVVAPGLFSFVKVPWCYALKFGLTFLLSAVVTFFVLFPPMWVAPYPTLKYIVEGSLASTSDHAGEVGGSLSYFPGLGLYIKLLLFQQGQLCLLL